MIYMRSPRLDAWHFFKNCSAFRRIKAKRMVTNLGPERPNSRELCNECLSKERRGVGVPIELPTE